MRPPGETAKKTLTAWRDEENDNGEGGAGCVEMQGLDDAHRASSAPVSVRLQISKNSMPIWASIHAEASSRFLALIFPKLL
jgi:hypothetical protein